MLYEKSYFSGPLQPSRSPADAQDAIATRLLAEAAAEQAWATRFAATTDVQWDRIAESVRRAVAGGDRMPLDDVFPQTRRLYS